MSTHTRTDEDTASLERCNRDHILNVARRAAEHMVWRDGCVVELTPGDATLYIVTIARSFESKITESGILDHHSPPHQMFMACNIGKGVMQWDDFVNQDPPHTGYVRSRMAPRDQHTGAVLGEFVRCFAGHYKFLVETQSAF